jgi:hypothetical protein
MKFTTKTRQRIIDDYLAETGRNMFVPPEFVDWLAGKPDHEAYPWFFGKDDAEAAREYRIGLARRMASGLRIVVSTQETTAQVIHVTTREYPAYVSPISGRKAGGGYARFDPDDEASIAELRRQGATALRAWLVRYRGVAESMGLDMKPIEEIALVLDGRVAEAG